MILNDTQIKHSQTRKTQHTLNIHTNVNFVIEHNISGPRKTQSGVSWTPICWDVAWLCQLLLEWSHMTDHAPNFTGQYTMWSTDYFRCTTNKISRFRITDTLGGEALWNGLHDFRSWISNHADCFIWDAKTHPCLTHFGWVTYICVGKLTILASDNSLSPGRRQAIIWTNAGILLNGPSGTTFSEILIRIQTFSFKKMYLKMSSTKRRLFCLGLNVLTPTLV